MTVMIGIYCIYFNELDNHYYIGCSTQLDIRIQNHLSALKRGTHTNYKLQQAYNKYGSPVVEVLEECKLCDMEIRERFYIQAFNSYYQGFNNTPGGDSYGQYGESNTFSKYKEVDYINVLTELIKDNKVSYFNIAEITGVNINVIKKIASLKSHGYLKELCPEKYSILEKLAFTRNNSASSKGIVYPPILSPTGQEYTVNNIHRFAQEYDLSYQNLHKVLTRKRTHTKGWKLK
jgi:group I intron endonuclease